MTISIDIPCEDLRRFIPADLHRWPYNRNEVESDLEYRIGKYLETNAYFETKMVSDIRKELIALCHAEAKKQRGGEQDE